MRTARATRAARAAGVAMVTVLLMTAAVCRPAAAQEGAPEPSEMDTSEIDAAVRTHLPAALESYRQLLRFPNDAHDHAALARQTDYLVGRFDTLGFETRLLPTDGLPVILAERSHPGAERTVLVYLQSDGQPVDPSEWSQPDPYEPVVKALAADGGWRTVAWGELTEAAARRGDGVAGTGVEPDWRIFARSAADSKGPVAQFLAALTMADELGVVPDFDLKVIVDTEEELGSPHLPEAVERYRDALAADMLVIFDGPPHASGRPSLKFGARGIATVTLTTYGPRVPQHSGHYGNYVPNPAVRLAEIIASVKDDAGRVTIPGWYDGIELDAATRAVLDAVPDDESEIMRDLGIAARDSVGGSLQEAVQYPSLNVRGMSAGWVGDEARTIIPATAVAEIDVRLVKESDPERLLGLFRDHLEAMGYVVLDREPTEEERLTRPRIATFEAEVSYQAFRTSFDSEPGRWLTRAMRRLYDADPVRIRTSGGSIPISPFVETLDLPAVSVPTVNPDNNQHSPDENLRLDAFAEGLRVMLTILAEPLGAGDAASGGVPAGGSRSR